MDTKKALKKSEMMSKSAAKKLFLKKMSKKTEKFPLKSFASNQFEMAS